MITSAESVQYLFARYTNFMTAISLSDTQHSKETHTLKG